MPQMSPGRRGPAFAAAVAAMLDSAGLAAGPASAKSGVKAKVSSHKTLTVTGSDKNDKLTLRVKAGKPNKLQVDVGDDVLLGGPGQDILDGGAGDNVLLQD
jgi:Ca2+-binding RTX toxin-like protein